MIKRFLQFDKNAFKLFDLPLNHFDWFVRPYWSDVLLIHKIVLCANFLPNHPVNVIKDLNLSGRQFCVYIVLLVGDILLNLLVELIEIFDLLVDQSIKPLSFLLLIIPKVLIDHFLSI